MPKVPWASSIFENRADYTAFNTSASEGSILTGLNLQPTFPAGFWDDFGKAVKIEASGILGTTGTPTIIYQARLGTTVGAASLAGGSVGVSVAITTINNSSNQWWRLTLDIICNTPGQASGNTTLNCQGKVECPAGFASPFVYALEPTTPPTATWTQTIDNSVATYLNLSVTWSASSLSNTITTKNLTVTALN